MSVSARSSGQRRNRHSVRRIETDLRAVTLGVRSFLARDFPETRRARPASRTVKEIYAEVLKAAEPARSSNSGNGANRDDPDQCRQRIRDG
jgi:hypothetical protein